MRDIVPSREGPRKEISTELVKHNREWTPPRQGTHRVRPRGTVWAEMFERAQRELRTLTPSDAVVLLEKQPLGMLELFLLAEEADQGRELILRSFPKPGFRARQRYLPEGGSAAQR